MDSPIQIYNQHYNESHNAAVEAVFQAGREQGTAEAMAPIVASNTIITAKVVNPTAPALGDDGSPL